MLIESDHQPRYAFKESIQIGVGEKDSALTLCFQLPQKGKYTNPFDEASMCRAGRTMGPWIGRRPGVELVRGDLGRKKLASKEGDGTVFLLFISIGLDARMLYICMQAEPSLLWRGFILLHSFTS